MGANNASKLHIIIITRNTRQGRCKRETGESQVGNYINFKCVYVRVWYCYVGDTNIYIPFKVFSDEENLLTESESRDRKCASYFTCKKSILF
jgi:hypothetical protein